MSSSLSSFSLKKLPLAALIAIAVVAALDYLAGSRVASGKVRLPATKMAYKSIIQRAKVFYNDETLIILGNSRSDGIAPFLLSKTLFDDFINEVYSLSVGGAMPSTQVHMLDALDYDCVKEGHTVVFCLTPMCFNKHNDCFKRNLMNFYSLSDLFTELILNSRIEDTLYYIGECSTNLILYSDELSRDIKWALFGIDTGRYIRSIAPVMENPHPPKADKDVVNEDWVEFNREEFATKYYVDYAFDAYQIQAVRKVISEVGKRGGHCVLVMLPLPSVLREVLGEDNLRGFIERTTALARESEVPLLDYVGMCSDDEYSFFDGSHLTVDSCVKFTRRLATDLKGLNREHGFPVLDIPADKANRSLIADPVRISSSEEARITFQLSAGPRLGRRPYILLGSISGMTPGELIGPLPDPLPLNWDIFTKIMIRIRDDQYMKNFKGLLDSEGRAEAVLVLPETLTKELEGHSLWFCYVLRKPLDYTSNAVRVDFVE